MNYKLLIVLLIMMFSTRSVHSENESALNTSTLNASQFTNNYPIDLIEPRTQSYTSTEPISINGDVDLNQTAFDLGMQGNGTPSSPYVFTNLAITGNQTLPLISLSSVTRHIQIQNNILNNGTFGIKLFQVANISIIENIISDNLNDGIFFENGVSAYYNAGTSFLHEIYNNSITDNGYYGVHLYKIWNSNTSHNHIANNYYTGIFGDTVKNDIYENNVIHDNRLRGFDIDNTWGGTIINNNIVENHTESIESTGITIDGIVLVYNTTITNNWISNSDIGIYVNNGNDFKIINNIIIDSNLNGMSVDDIDKSIFANNTILAGNRGFYLSSSQTNNFTNNLVFDIDREGILVWYSSNNVWINNTISKSGEHAFELLDHCCLPDRHSSYNIFTGNNFLYNNLGALSQGFDKWTNNTYSKNYWSDSSFVDDNGDNYGDDPYLILGTPISFVQSNDASPRTQPNYNSNRGSVDPFFTQPNATKTASGELTLAWDPAVDYWYGNLDNYSIYYSTDNSSWTSAVENLSEPTYTWNTFGLANGVYFIKLVSYTFDGIFNEFYLPHIITLDNLAHSLTKPAVTSPSQNKILKGVTRIYWDGSVDSWGLIPKYEVQYRPVGVNEWSSLDIVTARTYYWDHNDLVEGEYEISIMAIAADLRVTSDIVKVYIQTSSETSSSNSSTSSSDQIIESSLSSKSEGSESGFLDILNLELVLYTSLTLALIRYKSKIRKLNL